MMGQGGKVGKLDEGWLSILRAEMELQENYQVARAEPGGLHDYNTAADEGRVGQGGFRAMILGESLDNPVIRPEERCRIFLAGSGVLLVNDLTWGVRPKLSHSDFQLRFAIFPLGGCFRQ